ncbi:MAG: hypothetical protein WBA17_14810 [Saprospiraceae bacterium]
MQTDYRVGDTLTVQFSMPRNIFNRANDEIETIMDQDVTHRSWVTRVDSFNMGSTVDASRDIKVLLDNSIGNLFLEGNIRSSNVFGHFEQVSENEFKISYRFILLKKGVYWFRTSPFYEEEGQTAENPIDLMEECSNGDFNLFHQVNSGSDNNFYLLCEYDLYCDVLDESNRERSFDRNAGYVFRVTE